MYKILNTVTRVISFRLNINYIRVKHPSDTALLWVIFSFAVSPAVRRRVMSVWSLWDQGTARARACCAEKCGEDKSQTDGRLQVGPKLSQ